MLIARFIIAAVFFAAGAAKLWDLSGSRAAMAGFGLPKYLAAPLGVALPLVELAVGIVLIPAATAHWGALGALILLAVFVAGIANVMVRGREAECHCFGQLHSSRVGWSTLSRNLALALLAGFVFVGARGGLAPSYMDAISSVAATDLMVLSAITIALAVLAAAGWFMSHLLRQHGRLLLRLDRLEEELAARGFIGAPATGSPDGLAVGVPAPAFALSNLRGGWTTLEELLSADLPLMLVFGHPGCTPCVAMLPEIGGWQTAHARTLNIALISQGSADENRAASVEHGIERVLLQQGREIAEAYQAYATPSAVLVSKEGLIASPVVQGAALIRVMITSTTSPSDVTGIVREHENGESWREGHAVSMPAMGLDAS